MQLKYKIVEKYENENLIVARFYTDILSEEFLGGVDADGAYQRGRTDLSINLPIPTPTGQDLENYVLQFAPKEWLKMMEDVQNGAPGIDFSHISSKETTVTVE